MATDFSKYGTVLGGSTEATQPTTPQQQAAANKRGLLETVAKRPIERLIVEPGRRLGEAVGALATPFMSEQQKQRFTQQTQQDKSIRVPLLGELQTKGVKPGVAGAKQIAGETAETGGYLMPGAGKGASLGKKVLSGASTGYAFDVGSKLQEGQTVADSAKPGLGTATGAVLPLLGHIVGNFPKKMEEINMRMTPTEKSNLAKQGKDVVEWATKKKLFGSPEKRYAKVDRMYDAMEDTVGKTIEKSGVQYPKEELIARLKAIPDEFADDPAGYQEATNAVERVISFIETKAPEMVPAKLVNTYKRNLYKRAYSKNQADVVNEAFHGVASNLKGLLDESIPGLQSLNKEYGNILTARKVLFKAINRQQTGLVGKALGTIAGTAIGASTAGPMGAAGGAIVGEQIAAKTLGTATRSTAGATVQALQDVVNRIPTDKSGNLRITQKALITLLQNFVK